MNFVPKDKQEKGCKAEEAFQDWLNKKGYPFLYLEQSQEKFPPKFVGLIKRPDFIVFLFRLGSIFIDVKGYRIYEDKKGGRYFSLSVAETEKFAFFEAMSSMPVWLACIPEEEEYKSAYFFPMSFVDKGEQATFKGADYYKIPLEHQLLKRIPLDQSGSLTHICELI